MIFSDLHIHSNFSDGILTPKQIVDTSIKNAIKCISITDHDSIQAQYEVCSFNNEIMVIPGIEISSEYKGHEIHFLGYFIDIYNEALISILDRIREERVERINNIIERLNKLNINISAQDIEVNKIVSLGRPHIAKILMDRGYVKTLREAFHTYLAKGKPAYIERFKLNYKEALKLIKDSRGVAVLAHPGEIYKGINTEILIQDLRIYGLDGIEVFHPSHNNKDINNFYNMARKYRLVISGGSDFHGGNSKSDIGIGAMGLDEQLTLKFINNYYKYYGGHKL